jgi:hypothetical protein
MLLAAGQRLRTAEKLTLDGKHNIMKTVVQELSIFYLVRLMVKDEYILSGN